MNGICEPSVPVPKPTSLRLFFALWPDERAKAKLASWARRAHERTGGRLMQPDNLHLTLAFLGDTPADRLEALVAAAARIEPREFEWEIDTVGYWNHNRILWAGTDKAPEPLAALVADLRGALLQANFAFDPKAFVPHITLVRNARHATVLPEWKLLLWKVQGFALVKSVRTEEGNRYVNAAAWPSAAGDIKAER